jgi:hypothetical protein
MMHSTTLIFLGQFRPESFLAFAAHRAERLALRASVETVRADRIEISIAGEKDLIDAFEIACSLGPIDCLVLDHRRVTHQQERGNNGYAHSLFSRTARRADATAR